MADINNQCAPTDDPVEKDFRKKNLWFSFTGNMYGAFGSAAFIGLLGTMAKAAIDVAAGTASAAAIFAPLPLLIMGGLMAIGAACIYMSQKEYTEARCIGDQHAAIEIAKQKVQALYQGRSAQPVVEHEQNSRADGKRWADVVKNDPAIARA